jgi:hypothetical protein
MTLSWNGSLYIRKNKPPKYTRIPVIIDAIKVPKIAKMQIAPKLEKNGFG